MEETFDNINSRDFFSKHQSQRYNDELSSVRGRVPLPSRNENEPPQQVHHLVMTIRLGHTVRRQRRQVSSHDNLDHWDLDIRDMAWCDCRTVKSEEKGLIIFLQANCRAILRRRESIRVIEK